MLTRFHTKPSNDRLLSVCSVVLHYWMMILGRHLTFFTARLHFCPYCFGYTGRKLHGICRYAMAVVLRWASRGPWASWLWLMLTRCASELTERNSWIARGSGVCSSGNVWNRGRHFQHSEPIVIATAAYQCLLGYKRVGNHDKGHFYCRKNNK